MPTVKDPKKLQKRRSEDDMRKALDALVSGKPRERDDDHEQVLSDTIAECIEWRRIGMYVTQDLSELHKKIEASIKQMGQ